MTTDRDVKPANALPDDEAAIRFADNIRDRVKEWKRLRCAAHACCSPKTLGLGLHAVNQIRREQGLHELRSHWSIPSTTNTPERPRAGKE